MASDQAVSTAQALTMIQDTAKAGHPYPLLIIDLEMPEMDGLSLAQTVKNDPQLAASRIIMLTTLINRLNTTTMKATGISACLVKPIRQARLRECLIDAMSASGAVTAQPAELEIAPITAVLTRAAARSVRVLLAEDNVVNQRVAIRQLKKLGFSADSVTNGNEVLSALQRVPYDIIIMDCQMPEMDGYEVTRRIRQSGCDSYIHLKSAPYIIALTANAMHGDRERCLALGMNDYLTKPLHLHDLEAVLQRALLRIQPTPLSAAPVPKSAPELEALDRSVIDGLKELREPGQPDPLGELIDLFFKDAQPRLHLMETAIAAGDLPGVVAAAHTLKGSASNLGARRLSSLCATLEKQGKTQESARAAKTLAEVKSEFAKVRDLLNAELEN
jgi:CheY-like chemotaxis protein/HPt (histidine-containing phosphotransfer) domain-containing protein